MLTQVEAEYRKEVENERIRSGPEAAERFQRKLACDNADGLEGLLL